MPFDAWASDAAAIRMPADARAAIFIVFSVAHWFSRSKLGDCWCPRRSIQVSVRVSSTIRMVYDGFKLQIARAACDRRLDLRSCWISTKRPHMFRISRLSSAAVDSFDFSWPAAVSKDAPLFITLQQTKLGRHIHFYIGGRCYRGDNIRDPRAADRPGMAFSLMVIAHAFQEFVRKQTAERASPRVDLNACNRLRIVRAGLSNVGRGCRRIDGQSLRLRPKVP